jgi:hemerythrin-like domain-containing protein
MDALSVLSGEHRVIEQVLACLEKITAGVEAGGNFDAMSVRDAMEFFRHFADHFHHAKEEDVLFARLENKAGFSRAQGPTAILRSEHVQERNHVQAMRAVLDADKRRPNDMPRFVEHARAFVSSLRQHIQKEDRRLFPVAAEKLTPEELRELSLAFEHVLHADKGAGTQAHYIALANALADRYGVPHAQPVRPAAMHHPLHVPMPPRHEAPHRWQL